MEKSPVDERHGQSIKDHFGWKTIATGAVSDVGEKISRKHNKKKKMIKNDIDLKMFHIFVVVMKI